MLSVGEKLKRARVAQGLDLSAVAARTKINPKYLEAIEADDRTKFPSGFFYKSFVDQYAQCLSVDTNEIDGEVNRVLSADAPLPLPDVNLVAARRLPPIRSGPRFNVGRWIGSAATLIIVVGICAGISVLWRHERSALTIANAQQVATTVRTFAVSLFEKTALAKSTAKEIESKQPPAPAPATQDSSAVIPAEPAPSPDASAPTLDAANDDTTPDIAAEPSNSSGPILVEVVAHEPTWLSLASDGKTSFSGTLQPDQTKSINGKESAKMRVGNAGGIEIRFNGKPLGVLGARGQVLTVQFTADNFQIVTPPKESEDPAEPKQDIGQP